MHETFSPKKKDVKHNRSMKHDIETNSDISEITPSVLPMDDLKPDVSPSIVMVLEE